MFSISKETDYALSAIFYLVDKQDYVSVCEISDKLKISKKYLARIFSKLASCNILKSKEGKTGGYVLNKKLEDIVLYDFLVLFEDDLDIVRCKKNGKICNCSKFCRHKDFFQNYLFKILEKELKEKKLSDVCKYPVLG
ncbi:MAG: Rrf2 family transcriptional regulator [Patescibacteria group bacterium]